MVPPAGFAKQKHKRYHGAAVPINPARNLRTGTFLRTLCGNHTEFPGEFLGTSRFLGSAAHGRGIIPLRILRSRS